MKVYAVVASTLWEVVHLWSFLPKASQFYPAEGGISPVINHENIPCLKDPTTAQLCSFGNFDIQTLKWEGILTDMSVSAPQLQSQTHTVAWKLFTGQGWFAVSRLELNPKSRLTGMWLMKPSLYPLRVHKLQFSPEKTWEERNKSYFFYPLPGRQKSSAPAPSIPI